jgi:hypothetical protein
MDESPAMRPRASRIGEMVTLTATADPSARRRSVSNGSTDSPPATRAMTAASCPCRSGGTTAYADSPTISAAAYPNSRSAPAFHVRTVPSSAVDRIACSAEATMAARCAASAAASRCAVTSSKVVTTARGRTSPGSATGSASMDSHTRVPSGRRTPIGTLVCGRPVRSATAAGCSSPGTSRPSSCTARHAGSSAHHPDSASPDRASPDSPRMRSAAGFQSWTAPAASCSTTPSCSALSTVRKRASLSRSAASLARASDTSRATASRRTIAPRPSRTGVTSTSHHVSRPAAVAAGPSNRRAAPARAPASAARTAGRRPAGHSAAHACPTSAAGPSTSRWTHPAGLTSTIRPSRSSSCTQSALLSNSPRA